MKDHDNETVLDDWLSVSTEGFAGMNAGRPPAHLVKELLQNSLDALADRGGRVEMSIVPDSADGIAVTCRDNGTGIDRLRDVRTVFHTTKTDSHLQRGRMGRGFKELLCLSRSASIASRGRCLDFVVENGRRVTRERQADPAVGTVVTMHMPWPPEVVVELERYFRGILVPESVELLVNGRAVLRREPQHRVEASLPTEVFEGGRWLRPSRGTVIELVPALPEEEPHVFEMGIPVCAIEWRTSPPYHADVRQRVPMNPCRDAVASGFLARVHRACLPVLLREMRPEQVLEDWVGNAAPHCPPEVQREVIQRGFGENIARSVPAMGVRQFDEDAREIGMVVIDSRQTSGGFREILQRHVPTTRQAVDRRNLDLVASAAGSGFTAEEAYDGEGEVQRQRRRLVEAVGGRDRVTRVMEFARWFCQSLLDGYDDNAICGVRMAPLKPVNAVATWSGDDVLTLGIDSPGIWLTPMGEASLSVLIHEAAHHLNAHHGRDFHAEVEKLGGRAARLMLLRAAEIRGRWPDLLGAPSDR